MLAVSRALSKSELEFYVRWLEYIPEHWNLNRILEKKVKNLTPFELERLIQINNAKDDVIFIKSFIEKVDAKCHNKNGRIVINISTEDNEKLSNIIKNFDLDEIASSKLSEEELSIVNNLVEQYNGKNKEDILSNLNDIDNSYAIEYIQFLIKNKEAINSYDNLESVNTKKLKKVII